MGRGRFYHLKSWQIASAACLARDRYECRIGLPGCTGKATTADHIVSPLDGGATHDLGNLQAACRGCNARKGNAGNKARQQNRPAGTVRQW